VTDSAESPAAEPSDTNGLHKPLRPSDELAKFAMSTPLEIVHHIRRVIAASNLVTVFSNRGKTFMLTRLLAVDAKAGKLVFDIGSGDDVNRQIASSDRNVFVCSPEGIKTQFVTGPARLISWEDRPAFVVDLPLEVIKLQRREYFRIQTPLASPLLCRLHDYVNPDGERGISLPIYDVSLGGLSLVLPGDAPGFEIGTVFSDCSLDLRQQGSLPVELEIRNRLIMQQKNGAEQHRIGCMFIHLNHPLQNQLQRYIAQLERERRALLD